MPNRNRFPKWPIHQQLVRGLATRPFGRQSPVHRTSMPVACSHLLFATNSSELKTSHCVDDVLNIITSIDKYTVGNTTTTSLSRPDLTISNVNYGPRNSCKISMTNIIAPTNKKSNHTRVFKNQNTPKQTCKHQQKADSECTIGILQQPKVRLVKARHSR